VKELEFRRLYERPTLLYAANKAVELVRYRSTFLLLYNPIGLFAANKAGTFVPHVSISLIPAETSVTDQHWSLRNGRPNQKK
jgi:hypothetical protein